MPSALPDDSVELLDASLLEDRELRRRLDWRSLLEEEGCYVAAARAHRRQYDDAEEAGFLIERLTGPPCFLWAFAEGEEPVELSSSSERDEPVEVDPLRLELDRLGTNESLHVRRPLLRLIRELESVEEDYRELQEALKGRFPWDDRRAHRPLDEQWVGAHEDLAALRLHRKRLRDALRMMLARQAMRAHDASLPSTVRVQQERRLEELLAAGQVRMEEVEALLERSPEEYRVVLEEYLEDEWERSREGESVSAPTLSRGERTESAGGARTH